MADNKGKAFIGWRVERWLKKKCFSRSLHGCVLGSRCFPPAVMNYSVFLLLLLFTHGHRRRRCAGTTRRFLPSAFTSATPAKCQNFACRHFFTVVLQWCRYFSFFCHSKRNKTKNCLSFNLWCLKVKALTDLYTNVELAGCNHIYFHMRKKSNHIVHLTPDLESGRGMF